ncbi:MAG TPA: hemerythrin domain-containing protein [Gammaproteobacteria bacterium]|nr:hemerythrin domain-containing protein [Gammaproteobacteria bacterium]
MSAPVLSQYRPVAPPDRTLLTDIDARTGWPDEFKTLLNRFPRDTWRSKGNEMADFWLDKHDWFRNQATAMSEMAASFRNERVQAAEFGTWLAPRLQGFLGALHGHHQIEDFHYFPAFREAEKSLAAGFDVLASDHELMSQAIAEIVEATNDFLQTLTANSGNGRDAQKRAADTYIETSERTFRRLVRHLSDEEDLIIPIMLDKWR